MQWSLNVIIRKEYAVRCNEECKDFHKKRRRLFFLQLFFILVFFPFVPAIIYSQVLWVWGIKNISIHSLEKRENLARQIRGNFVFCFYFNLVFISIGISGGFEAGLQLTFTIWLILKKVISVENFLNVAWKKGSYGNFFPSIPLISATSSFLTMMTTCVRLAEIFIYSWAFSIFLDWTCLYLMRHTTKLIFLEDTENKAYKSLSVFLILSFLVYFVFPALPLCGYIWHFMPPFLSWCCFL